MCVFFFFLHDCLGRSRFNTLSFTFAALCLSVVFTLLISTREFNIFTISAVRCEAISLINIKTVKRADVMPYSFSALCVRLDFDSHVPFLISFCLRLFVWIKYFNRTKQCSECIVDKLVRSQVTCPFFFY